MAFLRFLHCLFIRPLDPPEGHEEHEVDCPWCGTTVYVNCED